MNTRPIEERLDDLAMDALATDYALGNLVERVEELARAVHALRRRVESLERGIARASIDLSDLRRGGGTR